MENQAYKKIDWVLIITLIALGLLSLQTISNFDTGFHLATGKYILSELEVPLYDVFSYTAIGSRLIAHYWLSDVVFYGMYSASGYSGLIIFVGIISVFSFFIIYKAGSIFSYGKLVSVALLFLNFLTPELWVVRPQIFSYLFTSLLLLILVIHYKTRNIKWIFLLIPLMLMWANFHAGVVLGIALIAWYSMVYILENKNELKKQTFFILGCIASILVTLLNPNGYKLLTYSQIISESVKNMQIMEWKSFFYYLGSSYQSIIFFALMLLVVFVFLLRVKRIYIEKGIYKTIWISGLLLSSILLPAISIRHIGLFSFLAFIPFVSAINTFHIPPLRTSKIVKTIYIAFILVVCFYGLSRYLLTPSVNENILPVQASEFIRENNVSGNMFNTQPLGGWLMWELFPDRKIYYDGRSELYAGDMDLEMRKIVSNTKDWENIFLKREIEYVVMHYKEPVSGNVDIGAINFLAKLVESKKFIPVFTDNASIVLVKKSGENKKIAEKFGGEYINK